MEVSDHISELRSQASALAHAADYAGLDAAVPTCPGWRIRDLVRHLGYVHRWATGYVQRQYQSMVPELTETEHFAAGPADDGLLDWFGTGHEGLAAALTAADPRLSCWTFLPAPSPLAFWARRQAHETAIHCMDAMLAAGLEHSYPADFAADGIDELLIAFLGRGQLDAAVQAAGPGRCLQVDAREAGLSWQLQVTADGQHAYAVARGDRLGTPDCTLTGPAAGLYLLLWNRVDQQRAQVTVSGDGAVLDTWRTGMQVRWG